MRPRHGPCQSAERRPRAEPERERRGAVGAGVESELASGLAVAEEVRVDERRRCASGRRHRPSRTGGPCRRGGRSRRRAPRRRCRASRPAGGSGPRACAPASSGLVVRMAMPPWLRLSVSAAAMVLPKRYCDRDAEHDARAAAAVEVVGEQVRRERRQDVLHRAVLVDVAGDAERRQLAHFVGAGDRAAEDQDRQPPVVELAGCRAPARRRPRAAAADRARSDRSCSRSARTRASSSAALLTVTARWPASSSAVRKRSRTNAVSSATTTVLVATDGVVIASCIGARHRTVRPRCALSVLSL